MESIHNRNRMQLRKPFKQVRYTLDDRLELHSGVRDLRDLQRHCS